MSCIEPNFSQDMGGNGGGGDMLSTNNLSDVANASTSRTNLGLGNVDNTSDLNKPISTATQTALDGKVDENVAITGATKTKITYDSKGLVTAGADITASDVGLGNVDNTSDLNKPISTATQTALDGKVDENVAITGATKTKITYDSKGLVTAGADITASDVGLGNVDNTSDLNKPISTATQTALDGKVDENVAITGATKTKITYDSKGLVTAGADVTEADITFTDITTNNVSTSKHGYCPKAPNDTSKFLRGDGTWETPAGGATILSSGGNSSTAQTLTIAGLSTGKTFTLTGNCTFTVTTTSSTLVQGALYYYELDLIQDGTGSRTITFSAGTNATLKMPVTSPSVSATATTGRTRITLECYATSTSASDWSVKDLRIIA